MSFTNLEEKRVKARKEHWCDWCDSKILKGEEYTYSKNITDGNFHSWKECGRCKWIVKEMFNKGYGDHNGCCTRDDFQDFVSDMKDEKY